MSGRISARNSAKRAQSAGTRDSASHQKHTRSAHAKERAEDYVEAIASLIESVGEARAVDLARILGVSHVTVVRTVARLQREALVSTQPYRSIFLTKKGELLARQSRERHETVVRFLCSLGVPAHIAERDAEGIEHHVSPETLKAMADFPEASPQPENLRAKARGEK